MAPLVLVLCRSETDCIERPLALSMALMACFSRTFAP